TAGSQVSVVQTLLSLHPAEMSVWTHPIAGSHESAVHALPSLQFGAGPPTHAPFLHLSAVVQALPSLQASVLNPVTGHTPAPSHPFAFTVQMFPSSQAVPAGSNWHVDEQQSPLSVLPSSHCSPMSRTPLPQTGAICPSRVVNWSVAMPAPRPGPSTLKKFCPQGLPWTVCGFTDPIWPAAGGGAPVANVRKGPTSPVSVGPNTPAALAVSRVKWTTPKASACSVSEPYGWVTVYVPPGVRPGTRMRRRVKVIWSPGTTTPFRNAPSVARVRSALPPVGVVIVEMARK